MARVSLEEAVGKAEHLNLKPGLTAIKKAEGKDRIHQGRAKVLGSVNIDDDCRLAFPKSERWDYLIGISGKQDTAWFVEVHSAETSQVSKMAAKFQWLKDFLNRPAQRELAALPRQVRWVASGRVNIPKSTPQYRRLREGDLRSLGWPLQRLDLP